MKNITDYKNFWLIWLTCAGKPQGLSLFKIQEEWGIKTNYLYHNESGLGKPLYLAMIKEGYLEKEGKNLKARFEWVTRFVNDRYVEPVQTGMWSPAVLISSKWSLIEDFIEKHAPVLFDIKNLRILYKNNKDLLGETGRYIFMDIFLYVLFSNLAVFTKKYNADIVMRIISTIISLFAERDLLNYMRQIHTKIGRDVPVIIGDERELNRTMYPFTW